MLYAHGPYVFNGIEKSSSVLKSSIKYPIFLTHESFKNDTLHRELAREYTI
jgi:hypothetical protein